jgi:hypothetical protein
MPDPITATLVLCGLGYGVAGLGGDFAGTHAAKLLTPTVTKPVSTVQKADEILRMKKETSDILARVEAKNRQEKEKANNRSVRALF